MAIILSHTHLSVCSVMLTLRASPKATPPLSLIKFPSRLCLDNIKIKKLLSSETHSRTKYKDKCVHGNQIAMVIVKSEWLNLALLVTEGEGTEVPLSFICIGNCTHRPVITSKRKGGTYCVINNIRFYSHTRHT